MLRRHHGAEREELGQRAEETAGDDSPVAGGPEVGRHRCEIAWCSSRNASSKTHGWTSARGGVRILRRGPGPAGLGQPKTGVDRPDLYDPRLNRSYAGFTLDPSDPHGQTLLTAHHHVRLTRFDGGTDVELTVTAADVRAGSRRACRSPRHRRGTAARQPRRSRPPRRTPIHLTDEL